MLIMNSKMKKELAVLAQVASAVNSLLMQRSKQHKKRKTM